MPLRPSTKVVGDVLTAVKRQFGDEAAIQITDDDITRWVNDAQQEILSTNRLFKAKATTDLVSGTYEYLFPNVPILDVQAIWVDSLKIEYRSFQEWEEYVNKNDPYKTSQGAPKIWTEWAGSFIFWPTPNTSSTNGIAIYYTKGPTVVTVLTDHLSVPDLYYNRVVEYCMAQAYELDEDYQASAMKLNQFTQGVGLLANDESTTYVDVYPTISVLPEDL
jgi:hypothetical protein